MKSLRILCTVLAAASLAAAILLVHLRLELSSTNYLESVTNRADTARQLSAVIPGYASQKLPGADLARTAFAAAFTPAASQQLLSTLHSGITDAYAGRTTNLSIDLSPLLATVNQQGYSIPPGTVLSTPRIELNGLVPFLHGLHNAVWPSVWLTIAFLVLSVVLGGFRGIIKRLALTVVLAALFLLASYVATLAAPWLLDSLLTSSRMDAGISKLIVDAVSVVARDAGRFSLQAAAALFVVSVVATVGARFRGGAPRPVHKQRRARANDAASDDRPPRL